MECPKCGQESREGDVFCRNCGTQIKLSEISSVTDLPGYVLCPKCSKRMFIVTREDASNDYARFKDDIDSRQCSGCGYYMLYWLVKMADIEPMADEEKEAYKGACRGKEQENKRKEQERIERSNRFTYTWISHSLDANSRPWMMIDVDTYTLNICPNCSQLNYPDRANCSYCNRPLERKSIPEGITLPPMSERIKIPVPWNFRTIADVIKKATPPPTNDEFYKEQARCYIMKHYLEKAGGRFGYAEWRCPESDKYRAGPIKHASEFVGTVTPQQHWERIKRDATERAADDKKREVALESAKRFFLKREQWADEKNYTDFKKNYLNRINELRDNGMDVESAYKQVELEKKEFKEKMKQSRRNRWYQS